MKAARIVTKTHKKAKLQAHSGRLSMPGTTHKKRSSAAKISAQTQFKRIKDALEEVELIEAGTIKPTSLKEALNELLRDSRY